MTALAPQPDYGPAMRALHPLWQKAVVALFLTGGNRTAAVKAAGYNCTTEKSFHATASRLFADARVKAAIAEECLNQLATSGPEMLAIVHDIARNTEAKDADRLAATRILLDRSMPVQSTHNIKVEHVLSIEETDISHYRALQKLGAPQQAFLDRFGPNGLPRVQALIAAEDAKSKIIDTEYSEVVADSIELEDEGNADDYDYDDDQEDEYDDQED